MNRLVRSILGVLCIGVITLCGVLILQKALGRARLDLTEDNLYTLSPGTTRLLGKLNQPIKLRLYYSRVAALKGPESIRYYNNYFAYVRDLLAEYARRSGGRLQVEILDPRPFSDAEEEALRHGVKRFQLQGDEAFYFGLVGMTQLGKTETIEFFEPDRQEFVEYDISKLISGLATREKKKVGILASVPVMGTEMSPYMMQMLRMQGRQPPPPWAIVSHLRELYDVVSVPAESEAIDEDIEFLMVVHPKNLSEQTLFAIDQFVMRGGNLIVFTDPHCLADRPQQNPQNPMAQFQHKAASSLNALLSGWGVEMQEGAVAVDEALAIRTQLQRDRQPQMLLTYLNLSDECFNRNQVVSADLHSVRMLYAGVLNEVPAEETTVTPLLTTTSDGGTWRPQDPWALQMPDPAKIRRESTPAGKPLMLGCVIRGTLKTNFPTGLAPEPVPESETPTPPAEEEKPAETAPAPAEEETPAETAPAPAKPETEKPAEPETRTEGGGGGEAEEAEETPPAPAAEEPAPAEAPAAEEAPTAPAAEGEPETDPAPEKPKVLMEAPEGTQVIVFSDVDMIWDMLAYQQTFFGLSQVGDNAPLVLNALDYLGGAGDLIAIRTRGQFNRPFELVDEIERQAEAATATQVEALKQKIEQYQEKLRKLGDVATAENEKLIQSAALAERKSIQAEIRNAEKKLRELNAGKRERIESLKARLLTNNLLWAPAAVLLIAIGLGIYRYIEAKSYAARRAQ
jgi:ABC-type uncharacterized transport system involved in gliding motility auxiliary subunit